MGFYWRRTSLEHLRYSIVFKVLEKVRRKTRLAMKAYSDCGNF